MQQIDTTVTIDAPIETVFGALVNVQNNPHWIKSVSAIEMMDEPPLRVGSRFRETGGFMGVNMTDEKRVTLYEPPTAFGFEGKFLGNATHYELEALDAERTAVRLSLTGTPPRGTPPAMQRHVLKQAVKRMTRDLERLGERLTQ